MQLKLNRFTAFLLLVLLTPIVIPLRLYQWITGTAYDPQYEDSFDGDPMEYNGDKPIVISVWAKWASLWKSITDDIVKELRAEFGNRCEFAYIEITKQTQMDELALDVAPTIILRHNGKDVEKFPNLIERDELETAIRKLLPDSGEHSSN